MITFDETMPAEQRIARLEEMNAVKRAAALEHLGRHWVAHPFYIPQRRHALKNWEAHSKLAPVANAARIAGRLA